MYYINFLVLKIVQATYILYRGAKVYIVKWIIYAMIFGISTIIGILFSQKYEKRVIQLKEFKSALIMLKAKIQYTYEPLKEIFDDIAKRTNSNVKKTFEKACDYMDSEEASFSWNNAIQNTQLEITKEDKNTLFELGKMLGKTDVNGQTSQIDLTIAFLDIQIEKAEKEMDKNSKLYKTLGAITGIGIVIILL